MTPGKEFQAQKAFDTGLPYGTGKDYSFQELATSFGMNEKERVIEAWENHRSSESITEFWNLVLKENLAKPNAEMLLTLGEDIMFLRLKTNIYYPQTAHYHSTPTTLIAPELKGTYTLQYNSARAFFVGAQDPNERVYSNKLCITTTASESSKTEHVHIERSYLPNQDKPTYRIGAPAEAAPKSQLFDSDSNVFHEFNLSPQQFITMANRLWTAHQQTPPTP